MKTVLRILFNMYNEILDIAFSIAHRILPNSRLQTKVELKIINLQLNLLKRVITLKRAKAL